MGKKTPATVKITIPDNMLDDVSKQTIVTLERRVKTLENENQKLRARMSNYPIEQRKKILKELGEKMWKANQIWKDAIHRFQDEFGDEFGTDLRDD